jgi:hypothetical protein
MNKQEPLIVFEIHMFWYLGKISIQIFSFFKRLNFNFEHFFLYHISAHDVRCDNKTTVTGQGAYYYLGLPYVNWRDHKRDVTHS